MQFFPQRGSKIHCYWIESVLLQTDLVWCYILFLFLALITNRCCMKAVSAFPSVFLINQVDCTFPNCSISGSSCKLCLILVLHLRILQSVSSVAGDIFCTSIFYLVSSKSVFRRSLLFSAHCQRLLFFWGLGIRAVVSTVHPCMLQSPRCPPWSVA